MNISLHCFPLASWSKKATASSLAESHSLSKVILLLNRMNCLATSPSTVISMLWMLRMSWKSNGRWSITCCTASECPSSAILYWSMVGRATLSESEWALLVISPLGSAVAMFQVGTASAVIAQGIFSLQSNSNAVPNLIISSVNINGRFYAVSRSGSASAISDPSKDSHTWSNAGLIIGLVGASLIVVTIIWAHRAHKWQFTRLQTAVESDNQLHLWGINQQGPSTPRPSVDETATPVEPVIFVEAGRPTSALLCEDDLASQYSRSRRQSGALTLDRIGCEAETHRRAVPKCLSNVKLIDLIRIRRNLFSLNHFSFIFSFA